MYNFGVPSALKAYFDHIGRAGHTFKYTEKGPVGLLTGKKTYVFAARGGLYQGTPRDTQTAYVRDFLGFIGVTDVEFVYAEGLAISEENKNTSLARAHRKIGDITAPEAIALSVLERLAPEVGFWRKLPRNVDSLKVELSGTMTREGGSHEAITCLPSSR